MEPCSPGRVPAPCRFTSRALVPTVRARSSLRWHLALGIIECHRARRPDVMEPRPDMLDDRKAAILRAVVKEYIETAQPVGSSHVARSAALPVSSATVRNEMGVLERDGYLTQPHTSAGRIPTDKGYRFFVDHLAPRW